MPPRHSLFSHPDRERIEVELAMSPSVREVAERWGLETRNLLRYRTNHMTQEQIARIRGMTPAQVEVNIEELTRKGGEAAVIGFTRLIGECKVQAELYDKCGNADAAARNRQLQAKLYVEQAKIAALYPGRKTVNNNHLVLSDVGPIFDLIDRVLSPFPEARLAVTRAFAQSQSQLPALEHGQ